jgi:hypothetical protein
MQCDNATSKTKQQQSKGRLDLGISDGNNTEFRVVTIADKLKFTAAAQALSCCNASRFMRYLWSQCHTIHNEKNHTFVLNIEEQ